MSKKQILLIDDELILLLSMQRMLEDIYDITIANSGQEAIDMINQRETPFDLIICDVSMPYINGPSFYLYVLKHFPGMEKRIIFMTGGPMSSYLDDFFTSNKSTCLSKPFEYESLRKTISDNLLTDHT